jgi:hypothetical protein
MIELLVATAFTFTCVDAEELIVKVKKSGSHYSPETKEDIIKTIKTNTEPGCYEGSERNS